MHWKTRFWFCLSLALFLAAGYFWHLGERHRTRSVSPSAAPMPVNSTRPSAAIRPTAANPLHLLTGAYLQGPAAVYVPLPPTPASARTNPASYRLANTPKPLKQLMHLDTAILLENALLDTAVPLDLAIPEALRSHGDPGAYLVQSRGPASDSFRALLREAGAQIIAYFPHNAYLVRINAAGAQSLAGWKQTQAVVPFEPYYKLQERLLSLAVEQKPLPEGTLLNVVLFPDASGSGKQSLQDLGAQVIAESASPFGLLVTIQPPSRRLTDLAQLTAVQRIEPWYPRTAANDLLRGRIQVASDPATNANYLGLTGSNVVVNVNDTGVDSTHPALVGRVSALDPNNLSDPLGHGTHVAGIIAGDGSQSDTVINVPGSAPGANYRGMAPQSRIYVLATDLLSGPPISDAHLQVSAARTNAFISNNSWNYQGAFEYNASAASFDAAVRDALPDTTGSQPMLFVFSAGNKGFGSDDGLGGEPGSIESPATAKNVLTIGAIDSYRQITNEVTTIDTVGNTNTTQPFLGETDSESQVAPYSARGNVGVGQEGTSGRFKPDVVAPGSFIVSTRSSGWNVDLNPPEFRADNYTDQQISPGALNSYFIYVPDNASRMEILVRPSGGASGQVLNLPIYLKKDDFPGVTNYDVLRTNQIVLPRDAELTPGSWYYSVANNNPGSMSYDLVATLTLTNTMGGYYQTLKEVDDDLGPYYRFSSGTSMAAPAVSGLLALMKEFFEQRVPESLRRTNSPALMKALVINGARSVDPRYDLQVTKSINYQGWGLVNLTNSLPAAWLSGSVTNAPLQLMDQSSTNALATGESKSWSLRLTPEALNSGLRITLVWTDPPGNPNAAIKLVNDLDLLVTEGTNTVYYGNDIPSESDYNQPQTTTNATPPFDMINNVENVFLRQPEGTNYTITVVGRRVNVNAVSAQTNKVAQDFALVVSCGDLSLTNAFTLKPTSTSTEDRPVTVVTNGIPLLHERVGANAPLINSYPGAGVTNQWNFYVFTNTQNTNSPVDITNGPNVAFVTFLPPNLSRARNQEADIDLYVSTDPALTNLDATVLAAADKSVKRGGTELIVYTNAPLGQVYYIGVKSEDQQAAEFGLVVISSETPFDENYNGNHLLHGFPRNAQIPDGSPDHPGNVLVFAFATSPYIAGRVIVTNVMVHEDLGDLVGNLSHSGEYVVLNNHTLNSGVSHGTNVFIYDDANRGDLFFARPSDGPGSLTRFIGQPASGVWMLTMVDDALTATGRVAGIDIWIEPQPNGNVISDTVLANSFNYYSVDVPPESTNLIVKLFDMDPAAPLNLYVRRGDLPTVDDYDKLALISPPGGELRLGKGDVPPLTAGRYHIGVFNPNTIPVTFRLQIQQEYDLSGNLLNTFASTNAPTRLKDDAITSFTNFVPIDQKIVDLRVGVRIDHPRVSDLALRLSSPTGTRALLIEDRGGNTTEGFGSGDTNTGIAYFTLTENTNLASSVIKFTAPPFTNTVSSGSSSWTNGFEGANPGVYDTNSPPFDGWTVLTNSVAVLADAALAHRGTNLLSLLNGTVTRTLPTASGRQYSLSFAYRRNAPLDGMISWWPGDPDPANPSYAADIVDGNRGSLFGNPIFSAGVVGQSFQFDGVNDQIAIAPSTNLSLNSFTFEGWFYPLDTNTARPIFEFAPKTGPAGVHLWINLDANGRSTGPGMVYANVRDSSTNSHVLTTSPALLQPNQWNHVALTFDANQAVAVIYVNGLNGTPAGQGVFSPPLVPLTSYPLYFGYRQVGSSDSRPGTRFAGGMDELTLYNRSLSASEILEIYQAGGLGKCGFSTPPTNCVVQAEIIVPGILTNQFTGQSGWRTNAYEFTALTNNTELLVRDLQSGMLVDSFILSEKGGNSFVLGEESLDIFKDEHSQGNWILEVWDTRAGATNGVPRLISWQLQMMLMKFSPFAVTLTNGIPYNDIANGDEIRYFIVNVPRAARYATNTLYGTGDLILLGDQRGLPTGDPATDQYYVDNYGADQGEYLLLSTNQPINAPLQPGQRYYLGVKNKFDTETNRFAIRVDFDQVDPTNYPLVLALTNGIPYIKTIQPGPVQDYYQFTVSSNSLAGLFDLIPVNGNVNLLLRKATPVANPLPTVTQYDYRSANPGITPEQIIVVTNSLPVPISPGIWYLGVYNQDIVPVTYSIKATETTNPPIRIITLTNSVPLNYQVGPGAPTDFFHLHISETNSAARFQLYNLTGEADLVLRFGQLPTGTDYDTGSFQPGTNAEQIVISTNALTTPVTNSVPINPNLVVTTNSLCLNWPSQIGFSYYLQGRTNITDTDWVVISPLIVASDTTTTYCVPLPSPFSFFQAIEIGVQGPNLSLSDLNGDWYLAAINRTTNSVQFTIRGTVTPPTLTLTNSTTVTNQFNGGPGWHYYEFTISSNSTAALFEAVPALGDIALYARKVVTGDLEPWPTLGTFDYTSDQPRLNPEQIIVFTNSVPVPLSAGSWLLGVYNKTPWPVVYTIAAYEFAIDIPDLRLLSQTQSYTNTVVATSAADYYYFVVSSNAAQVVFDTFNADGNVDLYLKRGLPFPSSTVFDYASTRSDTNNESIQVQWDSIPVALSPGLWFLNVTNADTRPVTYSIRGQETGVSVVTLTNEVVLNLTEGTNALPTQFFQFSVSDTNAGARFELFNLTGNADLILRRWQFPFTTNLDAASLASGTNQEEIVVATNLTFLASTNAFGTNAQPAGLLLPDVNGDWYLQVVNRETVPVSFSLRATVVPLSTALTNGLVVTNNLVSGPSWSYYTFEVSDQAQSASFEAIPTEGDIAFVVRRSRPGEFEQWPTLTRFDYLSDQPGNQAEQILVTTNSVPVPLASGVWMVGVYNRSTNAATYSVFAQENTTPPANVTLLLNGQSLTNVITAIGGWNYYRFAVSTNAVRANFEVLNPNGAVNLYVRKDLPLPDGFNFHYVSRQGGLSNEIIVVTTSSSPASLTAGDWYLGVENLEQRPLTFTVRATEFATLGGTNIPVNPTIQVTNQFLVLTWDSLVGASYRVEGRTNITDLQWNTLSPVIVATNTLSAYQIALPSPYGYFQVLQLDSQPPNSTNPVVAFLPNGLKWTTNGFELSWAALANQRFQVQYATNLPPVWTSFPDVVAATNGIATYIDTTVAGNPVARGTPIAAKRFYRVILLP